MDFALAPEAAAAGYGLATYDTIGSTNAEAMARLRAGEAGPLWVVSRHQSEGRGRRGNGWHSPPGNLAATLALRLDAEAGTIATLGFVAGVAVVRALDGCCEAALARAPSPLAGEGGLRVGDGRTRGAPRQLVSAPDTHPIGPRPTRSAHGDPSSDPASPGHLLPQGEKGSARFALKWPNDVLAGGAKLAGILLETETIGQARGVVVGIGVNVAHAPEGTPYGTASVASLGHVATAEDVFAALSAVWLDAVALWDEGRGFPAVRELWLERAVGLGGPITVRSPAATLAGIFETLDATGQLVIRMSDGSARAISAGDVFFGAAATARTEAA